jgi:hypothetical protein
MVNQRSGSNYASCMPIRRQRRSAARAVWLLAGFIAFAIGIYLGASIVDFFPADTDVAPSSHRATLSQYA